MQIKDERARFRLIVCCVVMGAASTCGGRAEAPPPDQRAEGPAVTAAVALLENAGRLGSIWSGFWGPQYAVALYPVRGATLVVGNVGQLAGVGSLAGLGIPQEFYPNAVLLEGVPDGPFRLDYPFLGRMIAAVRVGGPLGQYQPGSADVPWLDDPSASAVALAVHEGFHAYQVEVFATLPGSAAPLPGPDLTPTRAHRSWFEINRVQTDLAAERDLLREALATRSSADAENPLGRYYTLRARRLAQLPETMQRFEEAQERWEGVATWVGYEAVCLVLALDADATRRHIAADLRRDAPMPTGWDFYFRWHLYAAGAAKVELLSRAGGTSWQQELEGGESLDGLVRRAYGLR